MSVAGGGEGEREPPLTDSDGWDAPQPLLAPLSRTLSTEKKARDDGLEVCCRRRAERAVARVAEKSWLASALERREEAA